MTMVNETNVPDVVNLSVDDAVQAFRAALVALVPSAEKVSLVWQSESTHDDWEQLAESVFEVMVANPVAMDTHRMRDAFPLARYDFDWKSYASASWLELDADVGDEYALVLVRFTSTAAPFDMPEFAHVRIDTGERVSDEITGLTSPTSGFIFRLRRRAAGHSEIVRNLRLDQ
ncbi:hypothetical protein AB0O95_09790 [Rhodoglobus sp. NPDC076762]